MIGLDSYSRQVFYLFGPHFDLYQSLNRLFDIRKIAVCSLWLSLPGDYRVTDEALLAEPTSNLLSYECFHCSLRISFSDFYLHSLQLVLCSVVAVKCLPVHQPLCNLYFILSFEISENILRNQQ